jgi:hypothetical protein
MEIEIPEAIVSELRATILPKGLSLEDYDLTISMNDESLGFLGVEGNDLVLQGTGVDK